MEVFLSAMGKSVLIGLCVWALQSTANAAVVVELVGSPDKPSTTFSYTVHGTEVEFDGGQARKAANVVEGSLPGLQGSFAVTWTATRKHDGMDANAWSFGPATALLQFAEKGWGVANEIGEKASGQLESGEAILLQFDLSKLTVPPGSQLVFSVLSNEVESYRIYQRTATDAGKIVGTIKSDMPGDSVAVPISGMMEYAITDPGHHKGVAMRITGFVVDVVSLGSETIAVEEPGLPARKNVDSARKKSDANPETFGLLY